MTGSQPRAVVADDSHFMRSVIADVLETGGVDVVGEARNGREAVDLVVETEPDVVTMDVEMPEMDGLDAVEAIMDRRPTPILMLSAHTDEDAAVTFEALDRGAVDVFRKPGGEVSTGVSSVEDQLVEMVRSVARADVSGGTPAGTRGPTNDSAGTTSDGEGGATPPAPATAYEAEPTLIVGASTGGPKVVERLLAALPRAADFRVLVVQHMPEGFTGRFAERLDRHSEYDVREAADGDRVGGGEVLVAPGGSHLEVTHCADGRLRVACTDEASVNGVRPSVDVAMESAAEVIDGPLVAVVLTGMGRDGAEGVRRIHDAGGRIVAQDEATAAVYGMPKRAVETGCVDAVRPIDEIPASVLESVTTEVS